MLTILTYFLPICAMGYAYFQVGVELWGSQGIGECTDHQMENVRSKRRVGYSRLFKIRFYMDRRILSLKLVILGCAEFFGY